MNNGFGVNNGVAVATLDKECFPECSAGCSSEFSGYHCQEACLFSYEDLAKSIFGNLSIFTHGKEFLDMEVFRNRFREEEETWRKAICNIPGNSGQLASSSGSGSASKELGSWMQDLIDNIGNKKAIELGDDARGINSGEIRISSAGPAAAAVPPAVEPALPSLINLTAVEPALPSLISPSDCASPRASPPRSPTFARLAQAASVLSAPSAPESQSEYFHFGENPNDIFA